MGTKRNSINDATPQEWDKVTAKKTTNGTVWTKKEYATKPVGKVQHIVPYKLPTDPLTRKNTPVYSGFFKYFPRAIAEVSRISLVGGIQHGQTRETLHWDRPKSGDELDALLRHVMDQDWGQVAWRALAHLEKHLEQEEVKEKYL